jgi:polysaccharide deacetylase 2 family uncharacterized protein YibQ
VAERRDGDVEPTPRPGTAARLLVSLLFLGLAGAGAAWWLGWFHLPPVTRVPRAELVLAPPEPEQPPPAEAPAPASPAPIAEATVAPAPSPAPEATAPVAASPEAAPPVAATPEATAPVAPPPAAEPAVPATPAPQAETPAAPVPRRAAPIKLSPAPDPALVETGRDGPLPIIGRDGREPWRVYARPFDAADARPRLAIVIAGLGLSAIPTASAVDGLPGEVSLSFDSYARELPTWIARARAGGHEVLLSLPMEPAGYPRQDPGPYALLTALSAAQNEERLDWVLSRATGYVGLTSTDAPRFAADQQSLSPILEVLKKRGLLLVEGSSEKSVAGALSVALNLPRVASDRILDDEASREAIDQRLADLEAAARQNGAALGIGYAYPATIERVAAWAKTLDEKGLALAPVSALAALPGEHQGAAR